MTREQYLATVLDEEQRGTLTEIQGRAANHDDECRPQCSCLEAFEAVSIIDALLTRGCEAEEKLAVAQEEAAQEKYFREQDDERLVTFEVKMRALETAYKAAESRLAAVRELRDTWHRNNDKYKKLHVADVVADLDRILGDAPTAKDCPQCYWNGGIEDVGLPPPPGTHDPSRCPQRKAGIAQQSKAKQED